MNYQAVDQISNSSDVSPITIGAGATVYSKSFSLQKAEYLALAYKAASSGAIDLTIQLEQSYRAPTTEGSADTAYVIPESMADIHANLADANWHSKALSPVAMPYARLKITNAAGVANTLEAKLGKIESDD